MRKLKELIFLILPLAFAIYNQACHKNNLARNEEQMARASKGKWIGR